MTIPGPLVIVALALMPFFGLLAYAILKQRRRARERDRNSGLPEPPFAPDDPAPRRLPRRFNMPQRAYLTHFLPSALWGFAMYAWVLFVVLSSGLLPQYVNQYGTGQSLPQRVWYSYLVHVSTAGVMFAVLAYVAAFVAISMALPAQGRFFRTRPLRRNFLFWASTAPVLAVLLAALPVAAGCSFLILLAAYGPVWRHLLDTAQPTTHGMTVVFLGLAGHLQAEHLALALSTRPLLMLLSGATTMLLIFSLAMVLFALTFRSARLKILLVVSSWIFIVSFSTFSIIGELSHPRFSRFLFLYGHLGHPPPAVFALVPVALSVALLCLAQTLVARLET